MQIVDCNTHFGCTADHAADVSLPTLLLELAQHGIAQAWTYSLRGVGHLADDGTQETLDAARQHPSLVPIAIMDPRQHHAHNKLIDRYLQAGAHVFRFFPREQRWRLDSQPFHAFLDQLRGSGAVLILSVDGWGSATEIARLTADYGLPVLLVDVHYTQMAECIAVMEHWSHLYAATNRLGTPGAIETFVREVGADRLLFGSEVPERPLQCALNQIWFADISTEDRAAIFAGNAARLLDRQTASASTHAAVPRAANVQVEMPEAEAPPRSRVPIIDVHAHLGRFPYPIDDGGIAAIAANRQKYNIDRVIVSSIDGIACDLVEGNRHLQELIAPHPWLLGYVVTNPNYLAESVAEMDRYYRSADFVGAKIHCEYSRTPTSAPQMRALFAEIARRGKPVKIHNAGDDWATALMDLARTFPQLNIIVAHAGPGVPSQAAIAAAASTDNIYLEFCTTAPKRTIIREAIERAGIEKILFGSDQGLIDPGYVLGAYQDASPSLEEWEWIAWRNPCRVFGF